MKFQPTDNCDLQPSDIAGITWSEATARWNNLSLCPAGEGSTSAQDGGNGTAYRDLCSNLTFDVNFILKFFILNIGTLTSSFLVIYDYD